METDYKQAVVMYRATAGTEVSTFGALTEPGEFETVRIRGFKTLEWKNQKSGEPQKAFGAECDLKKTLSESERVYRRVFCAIDHEEFPELFIDSVLSVHGREHKQKVYPKVTGILS